MQLFVSFSSFPFNLASAKDRTELLIKSRKNEIFNKKVFDTSYFGFSGRKLLGATRSVD